MCDGLLTGVVSWGPPCSLPNEPGYDKRDSTSKTGVYADVVFYNNWINKTLTTSNETQSTIQEKLTTNEEKHPTIKDEL